MRWTRQGRCRRQRRDRTIHTRRSWRLHLPGSPSHPGHGGPRPRHAQLQEINEHRPSASRSPNHQQRDHPKARHNHQSPYATQAKRRAQPTNTPSSLITPLASPPTPPDESKQTKEQKERYNTLPHRPGRHSSQLLARHPPCPPNQPPSSPAPQSHTHIYVFTMCGWGAGLEGVQRTTPAGWVAGRNHRRIPADARWFTGCTNHHYRPVYRDYTMSVCDHCAGLHAQSQHRCANERNATR